MISKGKKLLNVNKTRFNNLVLLVIYFMITSCADRIYLPNIGYGSGVALEIEKSPTNYISYSFYSNDCNKKCKVMDNVNFRDFHKINLSLITVEFSYLKLEKRDLSFVNKAKLMYSKLIFGIKQIEKNYKFIYEDMAKPILVKYHFVPDYINFKDILLKETSGVNVVYHYFHGIKNYLDKPKLVGIRGVVFERESLKSLAHEISHIAQKMTNFHHPNFDISTEKNEARATIFEMLNMISLAQLEYEENKKHLKIDILVNKDRVIHIEKNQTWKRKALADEKSRKVYVKKVSAKNNFKGYEIGEKEFFKLIGGQTISTWETKKIVNLRKAIRDKIRLEKGSKKI